jgi:hypothetical protein
MVKDMQNNLLTDFVWKRLDELILNFHKTRDYELTFVRLDMCYSSLRESLQECDLRLVIDLDDCILEILTVFEEYFYIKGYRDGKRSIGIFRRFLAWVKVIWRNRTNKMLNDNIREVREALEQEIEKGNLQSKLSYTLSQKLDDLVVQYYKTNGKTFSN